ncbi:hypothetical protein KOY_05526 [Bacillus cereus VDM021]|nr:hypothetical protein IIW_05347 [Bacillus cereus VD136]EOQ00800.1 hypothetical protein KOY_05526 [Bacillus cereus VDM021]OOG89836.1 hypothetical protein BTH41_04685 [Bacillus mycoides]PEL26853.1 hypothetical protein CN608_13255 [Bacillus pseudomycoides]
MILYMVDVAGILGIPAILFLHKIMHDFSVVFFQNAGGTPIGEVVAWRVSTVPDRTRKGTGG